MSADAIVAAALHHCGLSFSGPSRAIYLEALYPADASAARAQMGTSQSSCGLTCEAILRLAEVDGTMRWRGVERDWLRVPYAERLRVSACAVAVQAELGRQRGLWCSVEKHVEGAQLPESGDMLLIGHSAPGWGGVEHVFTVVSRDGLLLTSIDGGQTDQGNGGRPTAIREVTRELVEVRGELWAATPGSSRDAAGRPTRARRVRGWLSAGALSCLTR